MKASHGIVVGYGPGVGTGTIMCTVTPGAPFDPAKIGEAFFQMYQMPSERFPVEIQFTGA